MAFGARLGAGDDEDPVGELGQRRPDLLPVHHPLPVDEVGAGLHVGEIGAGVGFGVALTPEFVTREDLRHEPLLLRLGAERHQGRAEQGDTHVGNASRRLGLDIGEVEDDLLGERALTAADRGGKVDAEPATRGEFLLPRNLTSAGMSSWPVRPLPRYAPNSPERCSSSQVRTSSRKSLRESSSRTSIACERTTRPDGPSESGAEVVLCDDPGHG